jgi:hypothetical protein
MYDQNNQAYILSAQTEFGDGEAILIKRSWRDEITTSSNRTNERFSA